MDLFTTYIQIDKDELVADKVLAASKKVLSETPVDDRYEFGKTTFYNQNLIEKYNEEFKPLYDFILKNAFEYCNKIGLKNISNIKIKSIWISEMYKYGSHKLHSHNNYSELSGNFYVDVKPNSSDIIFNRHEFIADPLTKYEYENYNQYNYNEWRMPAEKGKILIWKSDLPHSVDFNKSDSRIAVSFNLRIEQNLKEIKSNNVTPPSAETPYFIRNWNDNVVNWSEALLNFNTSYNNNSLIKSNDNGFFVSHEAHKIDKVSEVLKNNNFNVAHLYFNILTNAKTFGKHQDTMDVWFWQCQGITQWTIDEKDTVTLNPGDLIYVPAGVNHAVKPLTPRIGISMSKE